MTFLFAVTGTRPARRRSWRARRRPSANALERTRTHRSGRRALRSRSVTPAVSGTSSEVKDQSKSSSRFFQVFSSMLMMTAPQVFVFCREGCSQSTAMNFAPVVHGSHRDQQQVLASDFNSKEVYMSYDLNAEGVNGVKDQTVVVAISGFPSVFETPVWNVDGSAVGTPAIWGLTEGGQPAIRGRSTLDGVGVRGEVTSGTGDGVQGQGSGSSSGVAGFGGNVEEGQQPGAGVFGLGGTAAIGSFVPAVAPGVRGIGGGEDLEWWELRATYPQRTSRPIRLLLIWAWEAFRTFRSASLACPDQRGASSDTLKVVPA